MEERRVDFRPPFRKMSDDKATDQPVDGQMFEFMRIDRRSKDTRVRWTCGTIVICVGLICWTITSLVTPPWLTLCLAIVPSLLPAAGVVVLIRTWRSYIAKASKRNRDLEQEIDPGRTTSGMLEDGTSRIERADIS